MKPSNIILQTGSDLVEIFVKHPIHYFPTLKKNKIIGYISKKKVLRLSTHHLFLEKKISEIISSLLEKLDHNLFFREIKELNIKSIPYLLWVSNRLEIHKKNKEDFFLKHKPVESISTEDITVMIENHDFPMLAFDGSGQLLMENIAAKKIRALSGLQKSPNPYLHWIKKNDIKSENIPKPNSKKRKFGNKIYLGFKCVYHLQHFRMEKGWINLAIFLSFQKNS